MEFRMDAISIALAFILAQVDPYSAEAELSEEITTAELRAHVYRLASPEFLGRKGPGAARASRHIAEAFQRLKLKPAFGDSYYQPIRSALDDEEDPKANFIGRNVAAVLPGSDPKLADEWILLSAHFDHLGKAGDTLYPGADDNATGVAMLLEVAERFALRKEKPKRTLVFIAFDQEETGLLGSTYFASHSPRPFRKLKACITADMLGRSLAGVMDEYVFALGSERSPQVRKLLESVKPPKGLTVGRIGADIIGTRSDYGPFRDRRIPFLFLSTGQHPDYHAPTDLPERIDYEKLRRISVWICDLMDRLSNDAEAPAWDTKSAPPDLNEVRTIRILVKRVLAKPELYALTSKQRDLVVGAEKRLAEILERGRVTKEERDWLVETAQLLLLTVF
jgi:hypothetical protein